MYNKEKMSIKLKAIDEKFRVEILGLLKKHCRIWMIPHERIFLMKFS